MVASVPLKRMPTTRGRQTAAQARTRGASPNGSARAPTVGGHLLAGNQPQQWRRSRPGRWIDPTPPQHLIA